MKQHKWHKEIKAWADGSKIEYRIKDGNWQDVGDEAPEWNEYSEYRIKLQPKKLKELYVFMNEDSEVEFKTRKAMRLSDIYLGKIKLEEDHD
jgi:hypothetical protein